MGKQDVCCADSSHSSIEKIVLFCESLSNSQTDKTDLVVEYWFDVNKTLMSIVLRDKRTDFLLFRGTQASLMILSKMRSSRKDFFMMAWCMSRCSFA